MENRFTANILLCKKMGEDHQFEDVFNNLELEEDNITFDIGVFLTREIVESKEEMFLLSIVFEKDNERHYHPIGTMTKKFNKIGKDIEFMAFKSNKVNMHWEGLYRVDFCHCNSVQDINQLASDELIRFIEESTVINSFTFNVKMK